MNVRLRLVLASALMLFLELALIRWLTGNVIHLGYFSNFVLLGSFLGVGLGFLRWNPERGRPLYFPVALAALVLFVLAFPVEVNRTGDSVVFFTSLSTSGPPAWLALPIIFCMVALVLAGPGELVAACFNQLPRLEAYRWDIIGSLIGISSFTVLSFLRAPSFVWGSIVAVLIVVLLGPIPKVWVTAAAVAMVGALVFESLAPGISWSPYYKVKTSTVGDITRIDVNGVPHQDFSRAADKVAADPQYLLPYERIGDNPLDDVLIVGAGSGTDVALALSKGAKHVDAVEIDPRIQQIGAEKNPDKPYDDPRVTVHINDGRAFLERTDKQYDLIIFALPDSLTLVAGASQLRLESYLFTAAVARGRAGASSSPAARSRCTTTTARSGWSGGSANTAAAAFGHDPCIDLPSAVRAVIVVGADRGDRRCGDPAVDASLASLNGPTPASDNRPFLYLKDRGIPARLPATPSRWCCW